MALTITFHVTNDGWKTQLKPYTKFVQKICDATINDTKLAGKPVELAVVLSDDAFVKGLNHQYRGKNKATNVLSFPGGEYSLGDIVLAYETVEQEAAEQGKTFRDHTAHLLVHGVLHVMGYDHEDDKDASIMEQKEIKILKKLGISNPYL